MSPEKFVVVDDATKLYTVMLPFFPEYKLHFTPAMVVVATGDPVEEIGPAPPSAASQTMISYSLSPLALELRKMS